MAEELRLEASIVDKFSTPLRQLRDRLRDVKTPDGVKNMHGDFAKIDTAVKNATKSIQSGLHQAMVGLSLPSIAAAASVGGVVAAIRSFSGSTIELRQFSRETGITVSTLKAFQHAASSFGVSEDVIGPALKRMTDNLRDFARHRGPVFDELVQMDPQLLKALTGKNADEALRIIEAQMAAMSKTLKGRQQAQKLAEAIFGTGEMARFALQGLGPLKEALEKFTKRDFDLAGDEASSKAFRQAIEQLQDSFERMSRSVAREVTPQLAAVMDAIGKFMDANRGKIGTALKDTFDAFSEAVKRVDWKVVGDDITRIGKALVLIADTVLRLNDPKRMQRQYEGGRKDEHQDYDGDAVRRGLDNDKNPYGGLDGSRRSFKPSSFGGEGGLLHRTAFIGGSGDPIDMLSEGVRRGLLAAFRELRGENMAGASGGVQTASYEVGGSVGAAGAGGSGAAGAGAAAAKRGIHASRVDPRGFGGKVGNWWNAEHVGHALERLKKEAGLSQAGAEGLVARWAAVEAPGGPTSRNPHSGALGIGQWLGSRKHGFGADFDSQLSHAIEELNRGEGRGGIATRVLRAARDAREGAIGASRFERAEGYNDRTGIDNFTGKSLAAAERVHGLAAKGFRPAAPLGSLLKKQDERERDRRPREPAQLNVSFRGMPKANIHSNGGDHFDRINVDRGRTRMWDA